jgi:DNA-binding PadR family transcriptional regulator
MVSPLSVKAMVLLTLLSGEELYGEKLIDRIGELTKGRIQLSSGSVHPILKDLQKEGVVRGHAVPPPEGRGGRPRIYYRLTARGRKKALAQAQVVAMLFEIKVPVTWGAKVKDLDWGPEEET